MRRLFSVLAALLFLVGAGSLGLTLYLWFGDWPEQAKATVDHFRSVAANAGCSRTRTRCAASAPGC